MLFISICSIYIISYDIICGFLTEYLTYFVLRQSWFGVCVIE